MKSLKFISFCFSLALCVSCNAQDNKEDQIKMALLAAPVEVRDGAHVYGFDENGKFITLREGTNGFIVRSDDPNQEGFEVVCYGVDAEPFMARGRDLKSKGKGRAEILNIREEEAEAGTLKMPNYGSVLHIYYGQNAKYNPDTEEIEDASYRYVIYTPKATQASTGLPLRPNGPGHPWLMFPGTHRAHIMITPPEGN
ncbi:hypothetical protein [Roseivirga seohaensis]|uniref:hypothetical protein n=1 Tax=Roseivirga seohaensis TaxID=1914963 RepID=UPI003BABC0A4